jgi:hypothetical protein
MLKLVMLAGLMLLIVITAAATRLMPHGTASETVTPQQVYFRLHTDDQLVAKPWPALARSGAHTHAVDGARLGLWRSDRPQRTNTRPPFEGAAGVILFRLS